MANAEIVAIGSELLLGQIVDTNSTWMAQRLTALGVNLFYKSVVGDNPDRMKEVLTLDRPYVKRSAWVHAESVPHVFYENIKSFSQREIPTFKTREEAMEWLVRE